MSHNNKHAGVTLLWSQKEFLTECHFCQWTGFQQSLKFQFQSIYFEGEENLPVTRMILVKCKIRL